MWGALVGALAIGASLGLLGSGGSILTLPVLVLLLHRPEKLAVAESLAIVGSVALAGACPYAFRNQVDWKAVIYFGLTGMVGACLGAHGSRHVAGEVQIAIFGLMMLVASSLMLLGPALTPGTQPYPKIRMMRDGLIMGCLTGFIGIGGGFLIVPTLVFSCGLAVHRAIGTSLVIVAINAFIGFFAQLITLQALFLEVSWTTCHAIAAIGIVGSLLGGLFSQRMKPVHLQKAFAVFIALLGTYILMDRMHNAIKSPFHSFHQDRSLEDSKLAPPDTIPPAHSHQEGEHLQALEFEASPRKPLSAPPHRSATSSNH